MTTTTQQIDNFIQLVQNGIDAWTEAGKLLVLLQRIDASILNRITAKAEWLDAATLSMFIRIGEGKIHPKVLLLPPATAEKVARLPIKKQEAIVQKPVQEIRREMKAIEKSEPKPMKHQRHESGLADKIPTVGFWKATVMNGKVFMVQTKPDSRAIPVVLDQESSFYLQILSPTQKPRKKPESPPIDTSRMTPLEKAYSEFRAECKDLSA